MNTSAFASSGGGGGSTRRISAYHNHHLHRIPRPPIHHHIQPPTGTAAIATGKKQKIWLATTSLDHEDNDANNNDKMNLANEDNNNNGADGPDMEMAGATVLPNKRPHGPSNQNTSQIKFRSHPLQYLSYRLVDLIHKAFEKEEKVDELELMINEICGGQEFIYRRQQEIEVLCQKTSFSKQEIKLLYWGWKLACPEGVLNELIFKDIYAQFFPQAGDASLYSRLVFQAMFAETLAKNEPITFLEYAKALSTLCRGTLLDKIKWMFTLYDINHDGRITYDEVYKISVAIYALLGFHVTPMHNHRTYEEHAKKVFAKLDQNSLGYVTFDQFKDVCLKNETMIQSMQQLNTNSI